MMAQHGLRQFMRHSGLSCGIIGRRPAAFRPQAERLFCESSSAEALAASAEQVVPKIIIFGGRGFVGSHICQEALSTGLKVVGISKSGTPPMTRESWVDQVEWVRGDALEPQSYLRHFNGAVAAISCIGGFGNNAEMLKVNGTANVTFIEAAHSAGVPRLVFVSAQIPNIPGIGSVLGGYVKGKALAEDAVRQFYPDNGVILRPSVIYGNRAITTSFSLPLQVAFQPLEYILSFAPTKQLASVPFLGAALTPPCSVQAVARAAVRAATDPSVLAGVMDVWDIAKYK